MTVVSTILRVLEEMPRHDCGSDWTRITGEEEGDRIMLTCSACLITWNEISMSALETVGQ